jgi:hypothetical protein
MERLMVRWRILLLASLILTGLLSSGATLRTPAFQTPTVVENDLSVTLTFANGHRLEWVKRDCWLYAWLDQRGVMLGSGLEFQVDMPGGYGGQLQPGNPTYVQTTSTTDSVTIHCTANWPGHPATAYRFTFQNATADWGEHWDGMTWQVAIDLPLTNLSLGIGALSGDFQPLGFRHWTMVPDNDSLQQTNYLQPEETLVKGASQQTFSLVTHPVGSYVAYIPNLLADGTNFTGFTTRMQYPSGVALYKQFDPPVVGTQPFQTPPFTYLFSHEAASRAIPQQWLDVRLGTFHDQWASLGLGRQHLQAPLDGDYRTADDWSTTHTSGYLAGQKAWGYYDGNRAFNTTGMFQGPRGTAANIASTSAIGDPEYNLPNASDLPQVIPGVTFPGQQALQDPKGWPYTQGTLAQLQDTLAHQRILGMRPGLWHRDYYPGCVASEADPQNATQWSRWDKTWTCSILWQFHPDWGQQLPDGTLDPTPQAFPNNLNPDYHAWKLAWHQYWVSLGMMGFFRDTGCFPCVGHSWYNGTLASQTPSEWTYFTELLHAGAAYVVGENPTLFGLGYGTAGDPRFSQYKEWAASLLTGGWGDFYINGVSGFRAAESQWDVRVARRLHTVLAGNPCCDFAVQQTSPPSAQGEARVENEYYAAMVGRWGVPDRVELISPVPVVPRGTVLASAVDASSTDPIHLDNPLRLPQSGRVRIGSEVIFYNAPSTGGCGHWQPTPPECNAIGGLIRGYEGTTAQAHPAGEQVTPLDDAQLWDWADSYWVYGHGASEVWVKYSDGSVWQRGGSTSGALPQLSGVQVATTGTTATITFSTDVPTSAWIEYDTFGTAEEFNGDRIAGVPPIYQKRAPVATSDPPLLTSHSITLPSLTNGALYHYRVVARGPAPATTTDATFTAAAQVSTPTPAPTSTPTLTPAAGVTFTASPATVPLNGTSTVSWSGVTDRVARIHLHRMADDAWLQSPAVYLNCQTDVGDPAQDPTAPIPSGSCVLSLAGLPSGAYNWYLFNADFSVAYGSADFTIGSAPTATATTAATATATPTATSTATATATPTMTATRTSTATPLPTATPTATATPLPDAVQCAATIHTTDTRGVPHVVPVNLCGG